MRRPRPGFRRGEQCGRDAAPPEAIVRMTEGFRRNAASLKEFAGFIAFELWRGDGTLEAVSKWESRAAFEAWRASDNFLAAHAGARGDSTGQAPRQPPTMRARSWPSGRGAEQTRAVEPLHRQPLNDLRSAGSQ